MVLDHSDFERYLKQEAVAHCIWLEWLSLYGQTFEHRFEDNIIVDNVVVECVECGSYYGDTSKYFVNKVKTVCFHCFAKSKGL